MPANEKSLNQKPSVLFLPGIVTPVKLSYDALLGFLGDQIQPILKELEVYATETPLPGYRLELEVEGVRRVANAAGLVLVRST